ncbi:protein SODIUM POTASSIUM ROOT DEFECTIVE 2-like [Hibiscus syriacus]|uniref:protein SODIUM POTASSIUM ROOT DEFECTIVE 2-like n=1 Tax=Hibiscus syriacus TaxID=106335 RepID=UPI0019211337|nr:protein SODIUM POTASSIUM ROOT DEFECTIVE 2-like [Hibiscus syriacus]
MKRMDFFCASHASTAICSSLDHRSMVRPGRRPIDRQDSKPHVPCSSELPMFPGLPHREKSRKSSVKPSDVRRKSSADIHDLRSPSGSSRYLLSNTPFIDWLSDSDRVSPSVPAQPTKPNHVSSNDSPALKSSSSARSHHQVVVLRVSIHCKGCEGKIRKHISKMEGVTSFSIDLATKKVTVIGDVTPSSVLASVSRVKNAQLWPSATAASALSSPMAKDSLLIKNKKTLGFLL